MSETLKEVVLAFSSTTAILLFSPPWSRWPSGTRYADDAGGVVGKT